MSGKGTEVAVVGLGLDEFSHDPRRHVAQLLVVRQAAGQHAGREVLAHELARPGDGVFVRRFPVAQTHHFQHPRVGIRQRG